MVGTVESPISDMTSTKPWAEGENRGLDPTNADSKMASVATVVAVFAPIRAIARCTPRRLSSALENQISCMSRRLCRPHRSPSTQQESVLSVLPIARFL